MSLLDVDEITLGKTVVQHGERIPGIHDAGRLAYGPENKNAGSFLYEQRIDGQSARSDLLYEGYRRLAPVLDKGIVCNRQEVVRLFLRDLEGDRKYFPILNLMHLINEWTGIERKTGEYGVPLPDGKLSADFLRRYSTEADKFTKLLKVEGGILENIAGELESELPREDLELMTRACEKGQFDSLILMKEGENYLFRGVVGDNKPVNVPSRLLGRFSLYEQTGGWTQEDLLWTGFRQAVSGVNRIYSKLAALYFEANYISRRKKQGQDVCLPTINEEGRFSIVNGEPILCTPAPVPRSFSFDRINARAILNGLHSAGKTFLICDIPLYIIRGLRGFAVPAKEADVPITRRIFHALEIEKLSGGGSLHSELVSRAKEIAGAQKDDLFIVDEFLQHASPDAAEPLEPIILDSYAQTEATFIVVDHRGESIEDGNKWNFWSPEYKEQAGGEISPTYRFRRGKPDGEVLTKHAKQLLRKVSLELEAPKEEKRPRQDGGRHYFRDPAEDNRSWAKRIEERVLGGQY